jgi:hypothetical protein
MRVLLAPLLLTAALGFGPAAFAADPPAPPAGAMAGPGMMGSGMMAGGMMGGGMMDMGAMQCMDQSDARLAAVKAELKLTNAQLPLWNALVEAEKANPQAMRQSMGMMQGGGASQGAQPGSGMMMMGSGPLPERLERHEKMMTAHMEALRKVRAAVAPLYDALTPDQKAKADRLLCGPMAGFGAGSTAMGAAPADHGH